MGIGIAFATGFLKGHTDYTKEQAAAAQKEKEAQAEKSKMFFEQGMDIVGTKGLSEGQYDIGLRMIEASGVDGLQLADIQNSLTTAGDTTAFGTGRNSVVFGWNYDDKKISESASMNLRNYQNEFSNPESVNKRLEQFLANPGAAQQFLGSVDGYLIQYAQDFHFDNSYDTVSNELKSPVYTDYAQFNNVVTFADTLRTAMGMSSEAVDYRVLQSAIQATTKGRGLGENEVFVKSPGSEGQGGFAGNVYTLAEGELGKKQKQFLNKLAASKGYIDGNHMLFNMEDYMYGNDAGNNLDILLNQTMALSEAKLDQMLLRSDPDVTREVSDILFNQVSDTGNTARFIDAILPLIPEPQQFKVKGIRVPKVNGRDFMEAKGIDVGKKEERNEFANKSVQLATAIYNNIDPATGQVKIGLAGFLQQLRLGIAGPGGQLDQIFGGLSPDELEEGTNADTLQATLMTALKKVEITTLDQIGETQLATIQLAYARARAVDTNGRLSDNDFKIQLEAIIGTGLFQNKNVAQGKLKRIIDESAQMVEDTQFYVNFASRQVDSIAAREFIAYTRVVEPAAKEHRRKQGGAISETASTPMLWSEMQKTGTYKDVSTYQRDGYQYKRDENLRLIEINNTTGTARVVTDPSELGDFYVAPGSAEPTPPPANPEEGPAPTPSPAGAEASGTGKPEPISQEVTPTMISALSAEGMKAKPSKTVAGAFDIGGMLYDRVEINNQVYYKPRGK